MESSHGLLALPLTDPRSADLLYHTGHNVAVLQQQLRDLRQSDTSYASSVLFFTKGMCTVEDNEMLFTYIRTVLEILTLHSTETSDLHWFSDDRASYLSRNVETLTKDGPIFLRSRPRFYWQRPGSMREVQGRMRYVNYRHSIGLGDTDGRNWCSQLSLYFIPITFQVSPILRALPDT